MAEHGKRLSAEEVAAILRKDNPNLLIAVYETGNAVAIWHDEKTGWVAFVAKLVNGEWAKDPAVLVDGKPVYDQTKWRPYDGAKGGA